MANANVSATTVVVNSPSTVTAGFLATSASGSSNSTIIFQDAVATGVSGQTATTTTRTLVISNGGNGTLTISSLTTTGDFPPAVTLPITIAAGNSANVVVTFAPSAVGTRTGSLALVSNDSANQVTVYNLQGNGRSSPLLPGGITGTLSYGTVAYGGGPYTPTSVPVATGGSISYSSGTPAVATVDPSSANLTPVASSGTAVTITATYVPDSNHYGTGTTTASVTVGKGTPTITWATPSAIVYGNALGSSQLNASASVPGTLTYTPAAGTVLSAGNGQTLGVNLAPTDSNDYTTASGSVQINVSKAANATPSIGVSANPSTYANSVAFTASGGTTGNYAWAINSSALGGSSGTYSSGTWSITGNVLTVTPASATAYTVGLTDTGNSNYNASSQATVTETVNKATPAISWSPSTSTLTEANTLPAGFFDAVANAVTGGAAPTGTYSYTIASGPGQVSQAVTTGTAIALPGAYTIQVTYSGDGNYNSVTTSGSANIALSVAAPSITFIGQISDTYAGTAPTFTGTAVSGAGDSTISSVAGYLDGSSTAFATTSSISGGNWSLGGSNLWSGGGHTLKFTATDSIGNTVSVLPAFTVNKAANSTPSIAVSANPSTYAAAVTFTASGGATGNYAWAINSSALSGASGSYASGSWSISGNVLTVMPGSATGYTVGLADSGNGNYLASSQASVSETVNKGTPSVSWSPSTTTLTEDNKLPNGFFDAVANAVSGGVAPTGTYTYTITAGPGHVEAQLAQLNAGNFTGF